MRFAAALLPFLMAVAAGAAETPALRVTLLGTGTPNPRIERLGPSTLVEAGAQRLVFDAGRGTSIRLEQAGVRTGAITAVFLTHLHSDHTVGLDDLWLTGWIPPFGGRTTPFRVIGPAGTLQLMRGLESAYASDIRMRTTEERLPASGVATRAVEFDAGGVVFDEGGVRVTAFEVDHGGELKPAFGYRIDFRGRSVVISGDTRYSENLIRHAKGADVLLHEVAIAPEAIRDTPVARFVLSHHTTPADAARVFEAAKPRLAVFTHFAALPNPGGQPSTPRDVMAEVAAHYAGRVVFGEDLMRISIGKTIEISSITPEKNRP